MRHAHIVDKVLRKIANAPPACGHLSVKCGERALETLSIVHTLRERAPTLLIIATWEEEFPGRSPLRYSSIYVKRNSAYASPEHFQEKDMEFLSGDPDPDPVPYAAPSVAGVCLAAFLFACICAALTALFLYAYEWFFWTALSGIIILVFVACVKFDIRF